MAQQCVMFGPYMGQPRVIYGSYGSDMVIMLVIWDRVTVNNGSYTGQAWVVYGLCMGIIWVNSGPYMGHVGNILVMCG